MCRSMFEAHYFVAFGQGTLRPSAKAAIQINTEWFHGQYNREPCQSTQLTATARPIRNRPATITGESRATSSHQRIIVCHQKRYEGFCQKNMTVSTAVIAANEIHATRR